MRIVLPLLLALASVAGCRPPDRVILVYEIDTELDPDATAVDIEMVARIVRNRVHPNRVRVTEDGQIEVGLADDTQANVVRMDRIISELGTFELRVVANDRDHPELIELAKSGNGSRIVDEDGELLGWWVPLTPGKVARFESYAGISLRVRGEGEEETTEVLVANDRWDVNGGYLKSARLGYGANEQPCVYFNLNNSGGRLMAGLTGHNVPDEGTGFKRQLAIILNGTVRSAPTINSKIRDRGMIEGDFTKQQAMDVAAVLNGGSLPAPIKKVDQRQVASE